MESQIPTMAPSTAAAARSDGATAWSVATLDTPIDRFPQNALIGREIRSHKKRIGICSKLKELKQKSVLVRKRRIGEASLCLRTYSGVANGEARPKGENS